jgi:hypothetical protein
MADSLRIGLIDVDNTDFPNLVLMKLSAWYKSLGHSVDLLKPADVLGGINLFTPYDKLIGACVFTDNMPIVLALREQGAEIAGCGTDDKRTLPDEIEHIYPDYSLYGIENTAYGFLSRGCPRGCPFCIVAGKEGKQSRKVADLSEWWSGQKEIKLCDPNLLACHEHMDLLAQLADSKAKVDVNQGFDARLLTPQVIEAMNKVKFSVIHFAWDNPKDKIVQDKLLMFSELSNLGKDNYRKKKVYCLTNYWSTFEQDLYRVYWLRDNGYDPYVMIYDKPHASQQLRHLQRWVNNKVIFRASERFEEYKATRRAKNG